MSKQPDSMIFEYNEESIKSLDWKEHIRLRPGMYIGKLGDGSSQDDGIYVLLKEVIDNCIDEHMMGYGKNTGAKYDSKVFQKSVGLNGVGTKAVNALSEYFKVTAYRDGRERSAEFKRGELIKDHKEIASKESNGTMVTFIPDESIFRNYHFIPDYIEKQLWNYCYLNAGLVINYNGKKFVSKNGLLDLLHRYANEDELRYPVIHLKGEDIEIALSHNNEYGEDIYSFVNGQYTTQGGTHVIAFREAIVKTIRDFFKKDYDTSDIRQSIVAAIAVRVQEPVFESQTKTKLGSQYLSEGGPSMKNFMMDFLGKELDNYLHKNSTVAETLKKRIEQSERERKELAGIKKLANERAKKANLHNKKLRDCRIHLNEEPPAKLKEEFIAKKLQSTIFITEVILQADRSQNLYENEEFNLLQHALNIEAGIDDLRYNNIIIATDADVDGMHIRLLLMTFFLQFFPDLVRDGHVYILETPLFRVRNKQETIYCYSESEKQEAVKKIGAKAEITRFKGLGEISPDEFKNFIGVDMRKTPVILESQIHIQQLLEYYMGKNTQERQDFIVGNLRIESDVVEESNITEK